MRKGEGWKKTNLGDINGWKAREKIKVKKNIREMEIVI